MTFNVKKAERERVYVKISLAAPAGGGKTFTSLRLAKGMADEIAAMTGKPSKVLMVNTEASRGRYYANEYDYDIVDMEPPHNPEVYVNLINFAAENKYDVLIIDSASHEWEGIGGCLELQKVAGGTAAAWSKVTPRHNSFLNAIAESKIHIIATLRAKMQYEIDKDDRGKTSVKKLGLGAKQREGFEYEMTVSFILDQKTNTAEADKDNTHLFEGKASRILTEEDGGKIIRWANSSKKEPAVKNPVKDPAIPAPVPAETANQNDVAKIIERINSAAMELPGLGVGKSEISRLVKENFIIDGKGYSNYNKITDIAAAEKVLSALLAVREEALNKSAAAENEKSEENPE